MPVESVALVSGHSWIRIVGGSRSGGHRPLFDWESFFLPKFDEPIELYRFPDPSVC